MRNSYVNRVSTQMGPVHGNSKLSAEEWRELYVEWLRGASEADLAEDFGIAPTTVSAFVCGKTHKQLARPGFPREQFEREILGVGGAVIAALVMQASLLSFVAGDLLSPGSILRALWERRFWASRREARRLLRLLPDRPEPPTPTGPAAASALTPRQATERWTAIQEMVANGEIGEVVGYPEALRDFTAPRLLHDQAVPAAGGLRDKAWDDPDVLAIRGTKRFQVIVGGRSADGPERREA